MKTLEIKIASKPLSAYAKDLDNGILVLTSNKKPIAALVSLNSIDSESLALSTSPEFMEIIQKAREEFRLGKKLSFDEMKKEVLKMD